MANTEIRERTNHSCLDTTRTSNIKFGENVPGRCAFQRHQGDIIICSNQKRRYLQHRIPQSPDEVPTSCTETREAGGGRAEGKGVPTDLTEAR